MSLAACTSNPPAEPLTQTVAVKVEKVPPADLLVCPAAPEGFPVDAVATMPALVREATMRLATAYSDLRSRFGRLVAWHNATPCEGTNAQSK